LYITLNGLLFGSNNMKYGSSIDLYFNLVYVKFIHSFFKSSHIITTFESHQFVIICEIPHVFFSLETNII
jgi:hypothetical protein